MEVVGGQQLSFPCCEPAFARLRLALRAVPVSATVVGDGRLVATPGTGIDMTAQRRCPAARNSPESLELLKVETLLVPVQEAVTLRAEDVGHLHDGTAHFCLGRW